MTPWLINLLHRGNASQITKTKSYCENYKHFINITCDTINLGWLLPIIFAFCLRFACSVFLTFIIISEDSTLCCFFYIFVILSVLSTEDSTWCCLFYIFDMLSILSTEDSIWCCLFYIFDILSILSTEDSTWCCLFYILTCFPYIYWI